jgi:hypothetical protein
VIVAISYLQHMPPELAPNDRLELESQLIPVGRHVKIRLPSVRVEHDRGDAIEPIDWAYQHGLYLGVKALKEL